MKCKEKLLIFVLIIPLNLHAQLKEFMVLNYFQEAKNTRENVPWKYQDFRAQQFFLDLKDVAHFNTILFATSWGGMTNHDGYFLNAKNAGLSTMELNDTIKSTLSNTLTDSEINSFFNNTLMNKVYSNNIGFSFTDEPIPYAYWNWYSSGFGNCVEYIGRYSNLVRQFNKDLLRYANFSPSLVFHNQYFNREKFIQKYIDQANPNLLSFDFYPRFDTTETNFNGTGPILFQSLYNYALKSVENSIPFIYVLTPYKNGFDFTDNSIPVDSVLSAKSISEFNYLIYAALMYGAKGIGYWPGFEWVIKFTAVDNSSYSFALKFDKGVKESLYRLHEKLNIHSGELLSLNFASVYHKNFSSTIGSQGGLYKERIHDFCSWDRIASDKYAQCIFFDPEYCIFDIETGEIPEKIAISFLTDYNGRVYFWVFNKDCDNMQHVYLNTCGSFRDVLNDSLMADAFFPNLDLQPGEAKLITYDPSYNFENNYTITNVAYDGANILQDSVDDHLYPFESANNLTLSTNVVFESKATKSFMAHQIELDPGVTIIEGSTVRFLSYENSNIYPSLCLQRNVDSKGVKVDTISHRQIKLAFAEKSLDIYPNPVFDIANLILKKPINDECLVLVCNASGQLIYSLKTKQNNLLIDLSKVSTGLYFVRVILGQDVILGKINKK